MFFGHVKNISVILVVAIFIRMATTHLRNDYMHYTLINYAGACRRAEVCTVEGEDLIIGVWIRFLGGVWLFCCCCWYHCHHHYVMLYFPLNGYLKGIPLSLRLSARSLCVLMKDPPVMFD